MTNKTAYCLVIICCLVLIYLVLYSSEKYTDYVTMKKNKYKMIDKYDDKAAAAELIDQVNDRVIKFIRFLNDKYLRYQDPSTGDILTYKDIELNGGNVKDYQPLYPQHLIDIVIRLMTKYNPEVIYENSPGGKETSYTVNKGQRLYLCVRDADTKKLLDINMIMFVVIHELSHSANKNWGHETKDFWPIFKFLLREAMIAGIYKFVDYNKRPERYCGMLITYSVTSDGSLPNIWELPNWDP